MHTLTILLALFVALLHFYFMYLEMFLWTKPKGLKAFGLKKDFAEQSKVLAANQGLYNGFLAFGIVWAVVAYQKPALVFFLVCVVIAGIFGALSTKKSKLFYVQSVPALLALATVFLIK